MNIEKVLKEQRPPILEILTHFLKAQESDLSQINSWGGDVCRRLIEFISGGKLIRGGLVLLSHGIFHGSLVRAACQTAAAMELIQAAFLVHDDIMDRDLVRRGKPTMNAQYRQEAEENGFDDSEHFGSSMGICAGDIAFFLANQLLSDLEANPEIKNRILLYSAQAVVSTAVAQMQDVSFGRGGPPPDEAAILELYRCKTGRYSFTLPFVCGAVLASQGGDGLKLLESIGDELGLLFQIRDDELGLFGDEAATGKAAGSDVREGKRTLHMLYLMEVLSQKEIGWLEGLMGPSRLSHDSLDRLRSIIKERGIRNRIQRMLHLRSEAIGMNIERISGISRDAKDLLHGLLEYVLTRPA